MTLKSTLKALWPFGKSDIEKIQKLLNDIDKALEDVKFSIGQSHAHYLTAERSLAEIDANKEDPGEISTKLEQEISAQKEMTRKLKAVFSDLTQKRRQIEISLNSCIASKKNADTSEFLAKVEKDFGDEVKLNNYLEKFRESSFKIEFLASEKLQVEFQLNNKQKDLS